MPIAKPLQNLYALKWIKANVFFIHDEGLNKIRDEIINIVYLASGIFGAPSFYGSIMRLTYQGFHPFLLFYVLLFVSVWGIYFFRKRILTEWKSVLFFILFFVSGTILNIENGVVSGALHFIFVSTIITLLYGWRLGALTILLTLIARIIIALLYTKGLLTYEYNINEYVKLPSVLISTVLAALFTGAVIVFAINKFYHWLIQTLESLTDKVVELEKINKELEKANKKAIENDRLKTVFLTNMSHEVRTPMNAIIGFANLLGKPKLSASKRKRFSVLVQERSYDLLRLIEDILDISKIEIGQLNIVESEVELKKLLDEIYAYYTLKLKKLEQNSNVEIVMDLDDSLKGKVILTDRHRLKQVLNNLINNALKFTEKGSVEFGCKITSQIEFYVKDTGIGIPPDKQTWIFDRFRQADESISARQFGGTGLGLSICRGILELMGGTIHLESQEGKGSTFYFTLPFKESRGVLKNAQPENTKGAILNDWSLLIIEDDKASADYVKKTLSDLNINIIHSRTAAETMVLLKKNPSINLLLMDVRLPDMSGLELSRQVRKEYSEMKIIAQTAYASAKDIQEILNAGCNDYISKPIRTDDLLGILDDYLEK